MPTKPSVSSASASYQLVCVPPKNVKELLPVTSGRIKRGCERGDDVPYRDVERDLLRGHALLWLAVLGSEIKGVCVTQLLETENGKVCSLVSIGGERWQEWKHLLSGIENYARAEGCRAVRFYGRKGWARLMNEEYKVTRVIMEKQLGHVR